MLTNNMKWKKEWEHFKLSKCIKNNSEGRGQRVIEETIRGRQLEEEEGGDQGNRLKAHFEYCAFSEF